jgi:hypothetical protein
MPRQKTMPTIPTVHEALDLLTVDQLKQLIALLPTRERPTRKGEAVALVEQHLSGERLQALWEQLDATQKLAVAETIYADENVFNPTRFQARYGALPVFGTKKDRGGYGENPSLLRLSLYRAHRYSDATSVVPEDMQQCLLRFVPQPSAPALTSTEDLPEQFELTEQEYEWQEGDAGSPSLWAEGRTKCRANSPKSRRLRINSRSSVATPHGRRSKISKLCCA